MIFDRRRRIVRAAVGLVLGAVVVLLLVSAIPGLPSLNPFTSEEKDRSGPVVLRSVARLNEFRAATANLQVVIDVEQDAKYLPDFIKGERTLFVAAGNVDASVDFRRLKGDAIRVSEDRRSATITLPAPALSDARVDPKRSRVFDRDRGLLDRVGGRSRTRPPASASCSSSRSASCSRPPAPTPRCCRRRSATRATR
jgi:hypothetical protein